ncbi:MAG TPA: hypothetical protein VEC39_02920 [Vicinamibacterales bacterium]|nr:hypothetical protein [Vicinamibacterales bacterium]
MSEFQIRSESVDVEQIMKQIRQRILEKRGQDYTEDQIRELASVRLEKFLDPKNLRSDLLEQFRKSRPAPPSVDIEPPRIQPPYTFDDQTLFTSHRGLMRLARKLLKPLLKLMFNPNTLNQVLHAQAQFNVDMLKREARRSVEQRELERQHAVSRGEWNALYYEVLHNIVLETTRMGIEVQNLRMKVESLSSRLDFSERRVRALEGVVQYRPEAVRTHPRRDRDEDDAAVMPAPAGAAGATPATGSFEGFVPGAAQPADASSRRRRRRRRGRRGQGQNQGSEGASASGALSGFGAGEPGGDLGAPDSQSAAGFDGTEDDDGDDIDANGFEVSGPIESNEFRDTPPAADTPAAPREPEPAHVSADDRRDSAELNQNFDEAASDRAGEPAVPQPPKPSQDDDVQ